MSEEKYTSIFSRKVEAIVFIILQIFCKGSEKYVYEQPYCIQRGMFSFRCFPLRLHEQKTNLSGHFHEVKSLRYPLFGILKYGRSPCKQVTVLATVFKNKLSGYIAAPIKGGCINEVIVLLRWL